MPLMNPESIPTTASSSWKEARHLPWIDWLRFLAAFAVLMVHTRGAAFVEYGALPAGQHHPLVAVAFACTRIGGEAVLLFFVLSGFLVGGRLFDRVVAGEFRTLDYALDRVTRIFIPLLPALGLTFGVSYLLDAPINYFSFAANTIGLQEVVAPTLNLNDPLWSLSFEIWFYVLGGSLAWLVQKEKMAVVPALFFLASLAVFSKLGGSYLFCWVLGAVAWRIRPRRPSLALFGCGLVLIAVGAVMAQLNLNTVSIGLKNVHHWLPGVPMVRLVLATGYGLVLQFLVACPPSSGLLQGFERMGSKLAASSYTLYLTHYPVLALLSYLGWKRAARVDLHSSALFVGAVLVCCCVTWGLYFAFESRTSSVRRWTRSRLARQGSS